MNDPHQSGCAAASEEPFPEQITGVDMALGLSLIYGKKPLYLSLLRKFLAGHKDTAVAIRRALASDDWDAAELLAHNTKGVSGCMGATVLERRAADLERAIRTRSNELAPLLLRFETALNEMMVDLATKLPPE